MKKIRNQKPLLDEEGNRIKGGRPSLHPCVDPEVDLHVQATARRFSVSKSFVQNTALAEFFGVHTRERFDQPAEETQPRKRMAKANGAVRPQRRRA